LSPISVDGKAMRQSVRNYWINVAKLLRGDRVLRPLVVTYYVTTHCNLNCAYCEDFGRKNNHNAEDPLSLEAAAKVLKTIRQATDSLILTGGEPLLDPDIIPLVTQARQNLRFRDITILTNGSLLDQAEGVLPFLDRLVISLDSTDPREASEMTGAPIAVATTILDNVRKYAKRQRELGFRLILNCVLTKASLPSAKKVLHFCAEHDIMVSYSPQAVRNWPHYDLLVSTEYRAFLSHVIEQKRQGAPVLGSAAYLRTMAQMTPFVCHPTLVPRVMPNGDLLYPCRPIEREKGSHGGRTSNLLHTPDWDQAVRTAVGRYGTPPRMCTSCFQQCFAEPSLMQTHPFSLLREMSRYPSSRHGRIWTHAPG
jgi:MoaA/NifB/PqqE/SkfB family radical SAM enzyme